MPFKSQAQRRKFHVLVQQGKMDPSTLKKWEDHTPKDKKLPERVHEIDCGKKENKNRPECQMKKSASDNDRFRSAFMGAAIGSLPGAAAGAWAGKGSLKHIAAGATVGGLLGGMSSYLKSQSPVKLKDYTGTPQKTPLTYKGTKIQKLTSLAQYNEGLDEGRKSILIKYKKMDGEIVERKIDPLKVKDDNLVVAWDHERQAIRSFKAKGIKSMKKSASMGIDPVTAGSLGSVVSGYRSGISSAKTTSNMISERGYKTKNEDLAGNIAKVTGAAGAVAGLALGLKHKSKAVAFLRKRLSNHPDMSAIYDAGIPFLSGTAGGFAAGAATGGLVGLRGKFSKKDLKMKKLATSEVKVEKLAASEVKVEKLATSRASLAGLGVSALLAGAVGHKVGKKKGRNEGVQLGYRFGTGRELKDDLMSSQAAKDYQASEKKANATAKMLMAGAGAGALGLAAGHGLGKKKGAKAGYHGGIKDGLRVQSMLTDFKQKNPDKKILGASMVRGGGLTIQTDKGNFTGQSVKEANAMVEIAGLATLGVPAFQGLRGKHMSERTKEKFELGGLGILGAAYVPQLPGEMRAASKGLKNLASAGFPRIKGILSKAPKFTKAFL